MNKHILFVMRSLDNPQLFTQEEKEANNRNAAADAAAYAAADVYADVYATAYAAADAADAAYAAADAAYAAADVYAYVAERWVKEFFKVTGEDKQEYIDKVEILKKTKAPWHTLPGETSDKDKRMEMTQDNFYRVLAMNDELIHQQKDEIAKLKQTINKLRMKGG